MGAKQAAMDDRVTLAAQRREETGPVVLINEFDAAPEDAERLLAVRTEDAAFMKRQPGLIPARRHRGTAGSTTFVNIAVWESAAALGAAFFSPEFRAPVAQYSDSTVITPHVFETVAVPGICAA